MKLHVVHDAEGHIQAAALAPERQEGEAIAVRPVALQGQKAVTLDLSEEHGRLELDVLCTRFRIDPRADRPRLVPVETAAPRS
jgi:hypothetical protein